MLGQNATSKCNSLIYNAIMWTCFLLFLPSTSLAFGATSELQAVFKNITSMKAGFVQATVPAGKSDSAAIRNSGYMTFVSPNKIRWESSNSTFVSDGSFTKTISPGKKAAKAKLDYWTIANPVMVLISSWYALDEFFWVKKFYAESKGDDVMFGIKPRDRVMTNYDGIKLRFQGGKLTEMYIMEKSGQKSAIKFNNIKNNAPVGEKIFAT